VDHPRLGSDGLQEWLVLLVVLLVVLWSCFGRACSRHPLRGLEFHCRSFFSLGLFCLISSASTPQPSLYRCCAPYASMCPTPNGSGPVELEKSHHAPPTIAIHTSEDVPDAGLRSLDHCEFSCASSVSRPRPFYQSLSQSPLSALHVSFGNSRVNDYSASQTVISAAERRFQGCKLCEIAY